MKLLYRVGKKVGVFRFNPQTNEDILERGRIVARRLELEDYLKGKYSFEAKYAVRLSSGRVIICGHNEIWTKCWKGEKDGKRAKSDTTST